MRDIALLALLYGVKAVSKVFEIEESLLLSWIQELEDDEFFRCLRFHILSQLTTSDSGTIARKYTISNSTAQKILSFDQDSASHKIGIEDLIKQNIKDEKKEQDTGKEAGPKLYEEQEKMCLEVEDMQFSSNQLESTVSSSADQYFFEEWYASDECFVVNTENFISTLDFSVPKPSKKVKLNVKEKLIGEVIKEGLPLYKETALKFGESPRQVRDWVKQYKIDGTIKQRRFGIREGSSTLQEAYNSLISE